MNVSDRSVFPAGASVREGAVVASSLLLVALVGVAVAGRADWLFAAIALTAGAATAFTRWLFPQARSFAPTLVNLIGVYTAIFAFFIEEVFAGIRPAVAGIGFSLPVLFFLAGCWIWRAEMVDVAKSGKANVDPDELGELAKRGAVWLGASAAVLKRALATDELKEVDCGEEG